MVFNIAVSIVMLALVGFNDEYADVLKLNSSFSESFDFFVTSGRQSHSFLNELFSKIGWPKIPLCYPILLFVPLIFGVLELEKIQLTDHFRFR